MGESHCSGACTSFGECSGATADAGFGWSEKENTYSKLRDAEFLSIECLGIECLVVVVGIEFRG